MMAVLFGATYGAVRLLRGGSTSPVGQRHARRVTVRVTRPCGRAPRSQARHRHRQRLQRHRPRGPRAHHRDTLRPAGSASARSPTTRSGKSARRRRRDPLRPEGKDNAQLMRFYVPGATLVPTSATTPRSTSCSARSSSRRRRPEGGDAALAKPVVTSSGTGCPTPDARRSRPAPPSPSPTPSAS